MTRCLTIAMLLFSCGSMAQSMQQMPDFDKAEVKVAKLRGNLYLLRADTGSNMAASIGDDGVLLVDASYRQTLDKTQAALNRITDKPVRYLVNTHYHGDHTSGNTGFPEAVIIAHRNALKRLASGGIGGNFATFKFEYPPLPPPALPKLTFERELKLNFNGEEVRILHHPDSHTDGDAIVYFPTANVAHLGDQFTVYGFPDIDVAGGASTAGWIAALDDIVRVLPPDAIIIPGHGPLSNISDVKRFRNMLSATLEAVQKALAQGKTLQQMKDEKILQPWKNWSGFFSADVYLDMLYNDVVNTTEWPPP
jgi:cyclase